ncbi:hypothetical protein PFISCL1PPCAC_7480, partial [Pristionchus fissidentatus]
GDHMSPRAAAPTKQGETWSDYDKCRFFDPRNEFWDHHHCEYVGCTNLAGNCENATEGRWPIMVTGYEHGCFDNVHRRVPKAPSNACSSGSMTLCCIYESDRTVVVKVKPYHRR